MKGKCRWWNSEKGYGFLGTGDGTDIFCHYSTIQMKGRKDLKEGDDVEFTVEVGDKGPRAINVMKIEKQG